MQIVLLTHEREPERPTNTGRLVMEACEGDDAVNVHRIVWRRAEPDEGLLSILKQPRTGLLYPCSEVPGEEAAAEPVAIGQCDSFILLDGTWQEARKMYNRSPYLHSLPRIGLNVGGVSRFTLRRNQRTGCLCTAECVIEISRSKKAAEYAQRLEARFSEFLNGHQG